jgi:hypothetical protein
MSYWWRVFWGIVCGACSVGLITIEAAAQTKQPARLVIDHKIFAQPQRQGQPLAIQATSSSPAGIDKAVVFCRQAGGRDFSALKMEHVGQDVYRAVVPDWMTAGVGLEYYISATDQQGRSASQGFVGFPLIVRLAPPRQQSSEDRVKALDDTLEQLRKSRETPTPTMPGGYADPSPRR